MFLSELIRERREEERGPTGRWAAGQTSRGRLVNPTLQESRPPARPPATETIIIQTREWITTRTVHQNYIWSH